MNPEAALRHVLEDLPTAATATFLALFPIVNPPGGVPLFFSLTRDYSREERNRTGLSTALYVIAILITFMLVGRFVLSFFGISLPVLKIAGGLIVANPAWGMVTASSRMTSEEAARPSPRKIFLSLDGRPCSPVGLDQVVMGLAAHANGFFAYVGMVIGIIVLGFTVYLFLCLGGPLVKRLGPSGMGAITRTAF